MTVETTTEPTIGIRVQPEKNGMLDPRILVMFDPSPALYDLLKQYEFDNPHLLVAVASVREIDYGEEAKHEEYEQTSAYLVSLRSLFTYVQFARPGKNRISVTVVNISGKPGSRRASEIRDGYDVVSKYDGSIDDRNNLPWMGVQAFQDVNIPKEVFAPPPNGWKRSLVSQYFRGKGDDQCGFRKRWMAGLVIAVLHQLLGVIVRPAAILWAVLGLRRDIRWKSVWSFQLTAIVANSGASRWTTDDNGREREGVGYYLRYLSPLAFVGYAAVLTILPTIVFGLISIRIHDTGSDQTHPLVRWGWMDTFWIVNSVVLGILLLIGAFFLGRFVIDLITSQTAEQRRVAAEEARQRSFDELFANMASAPRVSGDVTWDAIPEEAKTLHLRFNHLKTKVCRPFMQ